MCLQLENVPVSVRPIVPAYCTSQARLRCSCARRRIAEGRLQAADLHAMTAPLARSCEVGIVICETAVETSDRQLVNQRRVSGSFTGRTVRGCHHDCHSGQRVVNRVTGTPAQVFAAPQNSSRVFRPRLGRVPRIFLLHTKIKHRMFLERSNLHTTRLYVESSAPSWGPSLQQRDDEYHDRGCRRVASCRSARLPVGP